MVLQEKDWGSKRQSSTRKKASGHFYQLVVGRVRLKNHRPWHGWVKLNQIPEAGDTCNLGTLQFCAPAVSPSVCLS